MRSMDEDQNADQHQRESTTDEQMVRAEQVVRAEREIAAPAEQIFELIADPARQPEWDGNDNLDQAPQGQRVRAVGEVFTMNLTNGKTRENLVSEFEEGRLIAWQPGSPGAGPAGHLWRWELEPLDEGSTLVTHIYDWSKLTDPARMERAKGTTSRMLQASIDRLAQVAEGDVADGS
ncbi:SRPBCC family protein [Ornithinimicrobium sp. Y1847]|uniref:SRPBCC family protein n=1 Tax=Ornithinimicrobium sp. Y1847 TaxID=3405419 RepID=UPI003B66B62A